MSVANTSALSLKSHYSFKNVFLAIVQKITTDPNKYVIGTQKRGGMGSCLHVLLNHLYYCEKKGLKPVVFWDKTSLYYKKEGFHNKSNAWEYYFEPLNTIKYRSGDKINYGLPPKNSSKIYFDYHKNEDPVRKYAARLIKKYNIRPNKNVQKKIDDFYKKNIEGTHTIAIHIRGTDKFKEEKLVE